MIMLVAVIALLHLASADSNDTLTVSTDYKGSNGTLTVSSACMPDVIFDYLFSFDGPQPANQTYRLIVAENQKLCKLDSLTRITLDRV